MLLGLKLLFFLFASVSFMAHLLAPLYLLRSGTYNEYMPWSDWWEYEDTRAYDMGIRVLLEL